MQNLGNFRENWNKYWKYSNTILQRTLDLLSSECSFHVGEHFQMDEISQNGNRIIVIHYILCYVFEIIKIKIFKRFLGYKKYCHPNIRPTSCCLASEFCPTCWVWELLDNGGCPNHDDRAALLRSSEAPHKWASPQIVLCVSQYG